MSQGQEFLAQMADVLRDPSGLLQAVGCHERDFQPGSPAIGPADPLRRVAGVERFAPRKSGAAMIADETNGTAALSKGMLGLYGRAGMPDRVRFGAAGHLLLTERICALIGGYRTMSRILGYVAIAEAVSFIVLLLAMVVKYSLDEPIGVEIMGPLHGVLFLAFVGLALIVGSQARWSLSRFAVVLASGVVPLAGWFVGHRMLQESA